MDFFKPDTQKFLDRRQAGSMLAEILSEKYKDDKQTVILALPRGGVPVAYEIATALSLPLDVFLVRKLGFPYHKECAMGAIATGNVILFNKTIQDLPVEEADINRVIAEETEELRRREKLYRGERPLLDLNEKIIILVDDGIATGASIRAAIAALQEKKPKKIIVAVPVGPLSSCQEIEGLVDQFICLLRPENLFAVSLWYDRFPQITHEEVSDLLAKAQMPKDSSPALNSLQP